MIPFTGYLVYPAFVLGNSALVRLQKKTNAAVRAILRAAVSSDVCWAILKRTLVPAGEFARAHRSVLDRSKMAAEAITAHTPNLRVLHGPFRGMLYPELRYFGGELYPKFIGSFERELHGVIEEICQTGYTEIVNIGTAEGHYLTGLGLRLPDARLYGFEIDPSVREFCRRMAEENGVAARLTLSGFCDAATLTALPLRRALIVSDCEGYEAELFTAPTVARLAAHDFLIEVHDNFNIEISSRLMEALSGTHAVERISSLDDIAKAREYDYPELRGYSLQMRKDLLMEGRGAIMEWFFCRSLTMHRPEPAAPRHEPVHAG